MSGKFENSAFEFSLKAGQISPNHTKTLAGKSRDYRDIIVFAKLRFQNVFRPEKAQWDVTKTGNGERGTGNGERGTGNRELGTSVQR